MQRQSVSEVDPYTSIHSTHTSSSNFTLRFSPIYLKICVEISIKSATISGLPNDKESIDIWSNGSKSFYRLVNSSSNVPNVSCEICRNICSENVTLCMNGTWRCEADIRDKGFTVICNALMLHLIHTNVASKCFWSRPLHFYSYDSHKFV